MAAKVQSNDISTYIVSGYMRSGTSMMMRALAAGGLDPVYRKSRDAMNAKWGDEQYKPNEGGFYELSRNDYREVGFPSKYEGKLIKCLSGGIHRIIPGKYKVVFMLREYEEIRQSYNAFFGKRLTMGEETYTKRMEYSLGILEMRRDVDVTKLRYRDVVNDPIRAFEKLYTSGWEIDPQASAEIVNPDLCRFRLENLEVGI